MRVVIEVSGGVVQDVCAGEPLEVFLVDYDNIREGDGPPYAYPAAVSPHFVEEAFGRAGEAVCFNEKPPA